MNNVERLAGALIEGRPIEEYWQTADPSVYVFGVDMGDGGLTGMRVTIEPIALPDQTPSDYHGGIAPHPFGWEAS